MKNISDLNSVIIVGATSGIGKALALKYLSLGVKTGITGRRLSELNLIKDQYPENCFLSNFDICELHAENHLYTLAQEMGEIDLIIVNSGVGNYNPRNIIEIDLQTIETNVVGFTRMAKAGFRIFLEQGFGHLVGISSVAGNFGYGRAAAYNASKAYVSNYLSGLRHRGKLSKKKIHVTDVQPGFIQTPLIDNRKEAFGIISAEEFAEITVKQLRKKPRRIIVPFRWFWAVLVLKILPDWLIQKYS